MRSLYLRLLIWFCSALSGCFAGSASAQSDTLYRCTDATGITLYTNQKLKSGTCAVLSVKAVPAPKQGATGGTTGSTAGSSASAKLATPTDFPKVVEKEQKARDTDRRSILESEMRNEKTQLDTARKQLADASKLSANPEAGLKDTVSLHERNIEALNKELGKLR